MGKKKKLPDSKPSKQKDSNDFDYVRDKFQPAFEYKPEDPSIQGRTEYRIGELVTVSATHVKGTVVSILGRLLGVLDRKGRIHYVKDFEVYRSQSE